MNIGTKGLLLGVGLALLSMTEYGVMAVPSHPKVRTDEEIRQTLASDYVQRLEHAYAVAKDTKNFETLAKVMAEPCFGPDPYLNEQDNKAVTAYVPKIQALIESTEPSYDSIYCQCYQARYYLNTEQLEKARNNYLKAWKDCDKKWRSTGLIFGLIGEMPSEAQIIWRGCNSGLALTYAKLGDLRQAEHYYREFAFTLKDLPAADLENHLRKNSRESALLQDSACLASNLGQAYEKAGRHQEALKKYADLLAYETFELKNSFNDPTGSIMPIMSWSVDSNPHTLKNFDKFIGYIPGAETLLEPYLRFGRSHPELVPAADLQQTASQVDKMISLRRTHAAMARNMDWRVKEDRYISKLYREPEKTLNLIALELDERKKVDNSDPALAHSMNMIGYQLIQVGLFREAEKYLRESIERKEKQGPNAIYALGNSYSNLGTLYLAEKKLHAARSMLEKAIKLRHGDPQDQFAEQKTQIQFARLLAAEGKTSEGESKLKAVVGTFSRHNFEVPKLQPKDLIHPNNIAQAMELHAAKSNEQQSGKLFYLLALIELSNFYLNDKNYDLARNTVQPVLTMLPLTTDLFLEARAQEKLGRADTAQDKLSSAETHLLAAETLLRSHKAAGMAAVDILNALGDLKTKQGDVVKAKAYYSEAAQRLAK